MSLIKYFHICVYVYICVSLVNGQKGSSSPAYQEPWNTLRKTATSDSQMIHTVRATRPVTTMYPIFSGFDQRSVIRDNITVGLEMLTDNRADCPLLQRWGRDMYRDLEYCDLNVNLRAKPNSTFTFCAHRAVFLMRAQPKKKFNIISYQGRDENRPNLRFTTTVTFDEEIDSQVFLYIMQYLYSAQFRTEITKLTPISIGQLWIVANQFNLTELMIMIEDFMEKRLTLYQLYLILKYAQHNEHDRLIKILIMIIRKLMPAPDTDWEEMIKLLCKIVTDKVYDFLPHQTDLKA